MKTIIKIILLIGLTSFRSTNHFCKLTNLQHKSPVDIKAIKRSPDIVMTSGSLPTRESKKFCRPNEKGFFGRYFLIHKNTSAKDPVFGQLIVFVVGKADAWKFNNDVESFTELTLTSSRITLWDKIRIGTTEKELLNFLNKTSYVKDGTIIKSNVNDYSLKCTMSADTISSLTVGKYCNTK